jgi:UDP-N-acetylglucosamine--N-acetylmuramyl-(pentapeptide) pyrophosphoryl-undecaprenol N-acetylglucosamine transferase
MAPRDALPQKNTPVPLRVVIAGGGTGGHLYPGIAVAKELLLRQPSATITFAGTAHGIESRVLPREGFALDLLRSGGLKGKSVLQRARGAALVPLSLTDAMRIVSSRRPDLVIGVGGYSSGPVVLAAALRGIPTMVLEQNAVPGLTNRLLAPIVRVAAVTFDSTLAYFGSKAFVSGNPVRPEFLDPVEPTGGSGANEETTGVGVLVFGGSQGAHAINLAMVEAAPQLAAGGVRLRLAHQTGERDVEMVRAAYQRAGLQADVQPFFFDMGRRLRQADLIVCRAGATTLAEVTAAGRPAILIPLPTATDDHQRRNAEALEAAGAARLLAQAAATGIVLAREILTLAQDEATRTRMGRAARALARPDAAKAIVDRALELIKRSA